MNIIQKQAIDFHQQSKYSGEYSYYKPFLDEVKSTVSEYRKISHKIEFINEIINILKTEYDEHIPVCTHPKSCYMNKFYENSLFFLNEEIEDLEITLPNSEFSRFQKHEVTALLETIIADLNKLKVGQQITFDDIIDEFKDLREYLYLDKKTFSQLMTGKLTEVVSSTVAGDIVSETVGKSLIGMIKDHYTAILNITF